jgi:hypothetical protein
VAANSAGMRSPSDLNGNSFIDPPNLRWFLAHSRRVVTCMGPGRGAETLCPGAVYSDAGPDESDFTNPLPMMN